LNYFEAVQVGRTRVNIAVEVLRSIAGSCHPTLFLKMGLEEWTPVGEEMLYALVPGKNSTVSVVICDNDGNSKAMSDFVSALDGVRISGVLAAKGIERFEGEVKLPV
jgi:hypothetical protein